MQNDCVHWVFKINKQLSKHALFQRCAVVINALNLKCHSDCISGFRVLRASSLDSRIVSSAKLSQNTVEDFSFLATVSLVGPPLHLAVSGDGLTLSVCVKKNGFIFAELYDIRAFAHQVNLLFSSLIILL